MIRRNKEILADFLRDVWNDGSVEAAERYVAPRYTIHSDPGDPWESQTLDLAGFKERVRQSRPPFPDQRFIVREMVAEGNRVAVSWVRYS